MAAKIKCAFKLDVWVDQPVLVGYISFALILVSVSNCFFFWTADASGSEVINDAAIVKLTDEILVKEIGMERYYLKYKILANEEPKLRELRYFLGQQASLGLFLGGDIVGLTDAAEHLSTPRNISIGGLKSAVRVELIGSIIGGASSATELCSNGFIAWKNSKHKRNPGSALLAMKNTVQEIRTLLARRAELIGQEKSNPAYNIYIAEGRLMQDYCDWCIYEFAKIYADAKSYQAGANVYYFLNTASNSLYGAAGGLALKGFDHPQYTSSSIVTAIIGDGISIVSAPAGLIAQKCLKKHYFKMVYKKLSEKIYDVEMASDDSRLRLHKYVEAADPNVLDRVGPIKHRLEAYDLWDQRYDDYMNQETKQLRRHDKIALQSVIYGPIISGTFLAQDVLGAAAWYGNRRRPKTANNLAFAGFITAGAGSAVGLTASTYYYVDEYLERRRLKREGNLPEQLLQKRLKTLDEVEAMIRAPR